MEKVYYLALTVFPKKSPIYAKSMAWTGIPGALEEKRGRKMLYYLFVVAHRKAHYFQLFWFLRHKINEKGKLLHTD